MFSKGLVFAILIFLCLIRANEKQSKILIDELYQDKLWVLEKSTDDSLKIYSKRINGINLMAFRVNKTVTIDPLEIINVVSDLENYANFISNSKNLKTEMLNQNDGSLMAYQHIKISLPFFSFDFFGILALESSAQITSSETKPPADRLSDPNLATLSTHSGIKYREHIARSHCSDLPGVAALSDA